MKRLFALLLALTAVAVLCACGTEGGPVNTDDTTDGCTDTTEPATEPVTEPPAPKEKVIYVDGTNGNDENDALTPETAVATYEKAFSLLAEDRNRIVITNTVRPALDYSLPEYDGLVVFTSVFDGVDYMEQNGASLRAGYSFSFNCDVLFENIHIRSTGNVGNLCFNFHNVTVGDNVNVTNSASRKVVLVAGYNVSDVALNADGHMTAKQVSHKGDCTVTVNSGSWHAIIGGNFREGYNSPMGTFDGNLTVNIGGNYNFYINKKTYVVRMELLSPDSATYSCVYYDGSDFITLEPYDESEPHIFRMRLNVDSQYESVPDFHTSHYKTYALTILPSDLLMGSKNGYFKQAGTYELIINLQTFTISVELTPN